MNQPPGLDANAEALRFAASKLLSLLPKWFVPGEAEIDCAASLFRRAREGAGSHRVVFNLSEVLCANWMGLCIISIFLEALSAKCNLSVDNQ